METTLKIYLIGVAASFCLQLMIMATSPRVTVKMLIGYILNSLLSWGCLLTFIAESICSFLERKHWNKTLWETAEYKEWLKKQKGTGTHARIH